MKVSGSQFMLGDKVLNSNEVGEINVLPKVYVVVDEPHYESSTIRDIYSSYEAAFSSLPDDVIKTWKHGVYDYGRENCWTKESWSITIYEKQLLR